MSKGSSWRPSSGTRIISDLEAKAIVSMWRSRLRTRSRSSTNNNRLLLLETLCSRRRWPLTDQQLSEDLLTVSDFFFFQSKKRPRVWNIYFLFLSEIFLREKFIMNRFCSPAGQFTALWWWMNGATVCSTLPWHLVNFFSKYFPFKVNEFFENWRGKCGRTGKSCRGSQRFPRRITRKFWLSDRASLEEIVVELSND